MLFKKYNKWVSSPFLHAFCDTGILFPNQNVVSLYVSVDNVCMLACATVFVWRSEGKHWSVFTSHLTREALCCFSTVQESWLASSCVDSCLPPIFLQENSCYMPIIFVGSRDLNSNSQLPRQACLPAGQLCSPTQLQLKPNQLQSSH